MKEQTGELECALCSRSFTEADVLSYRFFPGNHLCFKCCEKLRHSKYQHSCFGKLNLGGRRLGYDKNAMECQSLCPDRKVCPMFAEGSVYQFRDLTAEARKQALRFLLKKDRKGKPPAKHVFRPGSNIAKAFAFLQKGCSRAELDAWCAERDIKTSWLLRIMRKEECNGHEWTWSEDSGRLRIKYPR